MQGRVDSWRPNNAPTAGAGEKAGATPNGGKPAAETSGSTNTPPVAGATKGHKSAGGISASLYGYPPM